jgi:hypothetical protein
LLYRENPKGPTVWDLLKENPDRYIYPAVRHGVGEPLSADIAAGLSSITAQSRKIELQVAKFAHERLIVFTDSANDTQICT